jgi:hypothetical protein
MLSRCLSIRSNPGFRSFEKNLLPVVRERGIAVVE